MEEKLKLFVWEGVLVDFTAGMMVALAHDVEEARKLLKQKLLQDHLECPGSDLDDEPTVVTSPSAFYVWGGA